ncbi:PrsW family glutamic-type intramembrane protease [Geovibrio thiophilus]|uniref:PrsW family glutamic-type intramembrane protease n=1 Tax=Geovibrio thiophilus TaxID=139438 RepID=UPI0013E3EFB8|nr:PrsW family glutamic-type intramembrane protease [Geovibrio thiophilus]
MAFIINAFGRFEKRTLFMSLLVAFAAGSAAYHPAAWMNTLFLDTLGIEMNAVNLPRPSTAAYSAFVGINEEFLKCLITYLIIKDSNNYQTPLQGYVYAASAGLGFAVLENIYYLGGLNIQMLLMRLFISTPLHIVLALIWAAGINSAKFRGCGFLKCTAAYVFVSAALHGTYNYQAIYARTMGESAVKTLTVLAVTTVTAFFFIRHHKNR